MSVCIHLDRLCVFGSVCLKHSSTVKQSHYTTWERFGGEEVQLLLILDLERGGEWSASRPENIKVTSLNVITLEYSLFVGWQNK
jgi:hypothetical protein